MISVRADEFYMCLTGRKVEYRNIQALQSLGILEEEEGGATRTIGRGCAARLPTPLTYLRPLCVFPNPNYDLTKSLIPHLRPNSEINTLFRACLIVSSLVQTDAKGNVNSLCG